MNFNECVEQGGYISTIQKGKDKYQRTCKFKKKLYKDKIKKKKKNNGKPN